MAAELGFDALLLLRHTTEMLFAFLFKYSFLIFRRGDFSFQPLVPAWLIVACGLVAMALTARLYLKRFSGKNAAVLLGLRLFAILALGLMLLRPTLTVSRIVPGENLLAILVDNSRSMSLGDGDRVRADQVAALLEAGTAFAEGLDKNFQVRWYKFDTGVDRLSDSGQMDWQGEQTNIASGLRQVLNQTRNLPLGAVILISDGADNSYTDTSEVLEELRARKIPLYSIGVGPDQIEQDIELVGVNLPRTVLPDSALTARLTLKYRGFGGSPVKIEVRDEGRIVHSQEVQLPRNADTFMTELNIVPTSEGLKEYEFRVLPLAGETIEQNNVRSAVVNVTGDAPRILYVEGRPRWDFKFIRQATAGDKYLRVESLLRTALNKFYRQGIQEETTLAAGFPSTKEELFDYRGLILGNVESAFFTYRQMSMIREFVSTRGGGLLTVGGSSAFASGGFQNTPIEDILPVWLSGERTGNQPVPGGSGYVEVDAKAGLTTYGANLPALQLSADKEENLEIWNGLPALHDLNLISGSKPGATVLLTSRPESGKEGPLLISHRYGRGLAISLLTSSSWRWQMLSDHTDQSHERFWRQLLRWLVTLARDRVGVETERDTYSRNEPVRIRAEVSDSAFEPVNEASVQAEISGPGGQSHTLTLRWDASDEGIYSGTWIPAEDGMYRARVEAVSTKEGVSLGQASVSFRVSTGRREFFDAAQKRGFLSSLAEKTGGSYYAIDEAWRLPEEIQYRETSSSTIEVLELWNMPFNFLVLLVLLTAEWGIRRRIGVI